MQDLKKEVGELKKEVAELKESVSKVLAILCCKFNVKCN